MKNKLKTAAIMMLFIAGIFLLKNFKEGQFNSVTTNTSESCSEWQRASGHSIEMKWCVDEFGETNHRFLNDYNVEVHIWYKIDCTDGRSYTGNLFLKSGAESDRADMMKSKPSVWYITKKERQDNTGKWVQF
jgi:hypothetical protein